MNKEHYHYYLTATNEVFGEGETRSGHFKLKFKLDRMENINKLNEKYTEAGTGQKFRAIAWSEIKCDCEGDDAD
jgi:inhibitor of KinA sporulation pathway (predicted exonuclease)